MYTLSVEFTSGMRYQARQVESQVRGETVTELQLKHGAIQAYWLEDEAGNLVDDYDRDNDEDFDDDDGQPDEYTEWQDYMGGDDWDHGQYDY
jgi:hypothetical protein